MKLSGADYRKYPFHTTSTIMGIKRIQGLSTQTLMSIIKYQGGMFEALRVRIGKDTNPHWLTAQVAQELYERDDIGEEEFDRLTGG